MGSIQRTGMLRWARRWLHAALGRNLGLKCDVAVATEFHGSEYGGFAIKRDSLASHSVVLSFGVGEDVSFDLGIIRKYACSIHAFDPTPKSVAWVEANVNDPRFILHPLGVAAHDGDLCLYLPAKEEWVSASLIAGSHTRNESVTVPARRLSTIIRDLGLRRVDLLKMDIEGAEYSVLSDYFGDSSAILPSQIALEFHHFFPAFGLESTRTALRILRSKGYRSAWISPSCHEMLFVLS